MELDATLSTSGNRDEQPTKETRVALKSREEPFFSYMKERTDVQKISDAAGSQTVIGTKQYVITRHWKDPEGND